MPLSLIVGLMLLAFEGDGINTMTLGGLVVAIGSVVDDAIVDMENVYRRLRENQQAGTPISPLQIVFNGSVEVRVSVLFSTVIIAVVFAPVFALSGVEGRIFTPMAITRGRRTHLYTNGNYLPAGDRCFNFGRRHLDSCFMRSVVGK